MDIPTCRLSAPEAAEFADYFLPSQASDAEVLRAWGPRDGRRT